VTALHDVFCSIDHPRILVLGDVILDRYTFGNAERVSPEAPVLVLHVDRKEIRLGGAASVAMLLRGLEAQVVLAGVVGDDGDGRTMMSLLRDEQVDSQLVLIDSQRPTTSKERVIGRAANRHAHQIVRVDCEIREPISPEVTGRLLAGISNQMAMIDAILIADYAKGVCIPALLRAVIEGGRERKIPVIVDPARIADYSRYSGASLLKPNRIEAELATGSPIVTADDALAAGRLLQQRFDIDAVIVTLDRDGMALVQQNAPARVLPCDEREVYDITGAGDMVLATLGLCSASKIPLSDAARLANLAAGLEVERQGVAPITRQELRAATHSETRHRSSNYAKFVQSCSKLTSLDDLLPLIATHRAGGRRITFTNGCFDLLHVGHITLLEEAATLGDILIVAINSDTSVRNLKGAGRPIITGLDRARMLAALGCVDHVVIYDDPTPHRLLERIRPDILVKGGTTPVIIGREIVDSYGGRTVRLGEVPGISTTALLAASERSAAACQISARITETVARRQPSAPHGPDSPAHNPKSEFPIPR